MTTQIIKMKIQEESDLFSPLDPDRKLLSGEVTDYLFRSFQNTYKDKTEKYAIHITSDTPVNEESVKEKISEYICQEIDAINRSLKNLILKAVCLGIFGIVILSIWLFLSSSSENINLEILSIIGTVAVWESVSVIIMGRHDLLQSKKELKKMLKAEILISDKSK